MSPPQNKPPQIYIYIYNIYTIYVYIHYICIYKRLLNKKVATKLEVQEAKTLEIDVTKYT